MITTCFPSLLQSFFTDHLLRQRQASPHTVAGYRDSFHLLLKFAQERLYLFTARDRRIGTVVRCGSTGRDRCL
jgi:site-specific recombinase XerC